MNISYRMCSAYGCQTTVEDWNRFSKKCLLRLLSFIEILLLLRAILVCIKFQPACVLGNYL